MLALFVVLSISDCITYSGALTTRIDLYSATECFEIVHAFFSDIANPTYSGAVSVQADAVTVQRSTFLRCAAREGGALYSGCRATIFRYCCSRDCSSSTSGSAIYTWGSVNSNASVLYSAFSICPSEANSCRGTICVEDGRIYEFQELNFTQCRLLPTVPLESLTDYPSRGAVFYSSNTGTKLFFFVLFSFAMCWPLGD
jgi:hypothetical protein